MVIRSFMMPMIRRIYFWTYSADVSAIAKINRTVGLCDTSEQNRALLFPPSQVQPGSLSFCYATDGFLTMCSTIRVRNCLYMTWGRRYWRSKQLCQLPPHICTYAGMQERLRASYLEMGDMMHARVSPVEFSFQNSVQPTSTLELYNSDQSHPSPAGSYLAPNFFMQLFTRKALLVLTLQDWTLWQQHFLQNIAAHTVLDSLANWKIEVYRQNASLLL